MPSRVQPLRLDMSPTKPELRGSAVLESNDDWDDESGDERGMPLPSFSGAGRANSRKNTRDGTGKALSDCAERAARGRAALDPARLRDAGSMPGWGGAWGGADGSKEHESLDFDTVNTPFWVDSSRPQQQRGFMHGCGQAILRSKRLYQWLFTVAIGVGVALAAQMIQTLIALLISMRNTQVQKYYDDASRSDNDIFVFFAGYNVLLIMIAGVLTVSAGSSAAGDGVAEVKAYLNGSHIRGCFHIRAILVKFIGTILASAAGLACGPEGPMIHIGAGIAYLVTCVDSLSGILPALTPSILARFTNDRDRREFIAAGAGAGIAAAFGAPIGGVLFALEEAASHWSPQLIWRIFTSAMVATFTLALIRAGGNSGDISLAGLLASGTKISLTETKGGVMEADGSSIVSVMDAPVYVWELMLFAVLGAFGGVLGGLFNASYNLLAPLRPTTRVMRVVEVLFLSLVTSYTIFFLAAMFPRCADNGTWTCSEADNWGERCSGSSDNTTCVGMRAQCVNATGWMCVGGGNSGLKCHGRSGFEDCEWRGGRCKAETRMESVFGLRARCEEGQYDELATLFFGDKSQSIIRMVTQSGPHHDAPFSNESLLIAAAAYQLLLMLTYGSPLAAGFFMPCWLVGAALGRLFGQLANAHLSSDDFVYSGAYALAGAAAMLGGVQRASISLVFFIIEGTSNVHFLLPIVTTLLSANVVSR
jgi:chloride channel 6